MDYITREGEQAIRQFKYRGGDLSVSYHYVWSPLAELVLKITPTTIAPNTITLIGFLTHVVATLVLASFTPFNQPAPAWALALYGLSVFIYQTLDNVDGKQARRLHNSTPLGMIMDHGCDALGLLFLSTGMARVICLDDFQLFLWVFAVGVSFSFYISAWCQYHSGGLMILGKVNAVDDGIPVVWMCALASALLGQSLWLQEVTLFGSTFLVNELIAKSIIGMGFVQVYSIIAQSGKNFTSNVGRALLDTVHMLMLFFAVYVITAHSNLCDHYFPAILVGLGFTMSRSVSYTLLCSVAELPFKQFQPSVLVFSTVIPAYIFWGQSYICACYVIYGVAIFAVVEYSLFVVKASKHIAKVLEISIFGVFQPKHKTH